MKWPVASFAELFTDATGGNPKVLTSDYQPDGRLAVVDQGSSEIAGYVDDLELRCDASRPCLLFGDHTKAIKFVDFPFALGADGVKVLLPSPRLDAKYGFYALRQFRFPEKTGYMRHFKYLQRAAIPLPPLPEQKRIAAILDKADAIRLKRQESIRLAAEFIRSVFLDMFGDPVTNPKGWNTKPMGDLVDMVGGGTPSRAVPEYFTGSVCWATSKDMKGETLMDTEEHITEAAIKNSATKLVPAGSVLIVVKSKILLHSLPVLISAVPTCFGQDLKALIPRSDLSARYLARHLRIGQRALLAVARGVNTEGLTLDHLRAHRVMMPPRDRMEAYSSMEGTVVQHQTRLDDEANEADALFSSLSHRAFTGEL